MLDFLGQHDAAQKITAAVTADAGRDNPTQLRSTAEVTRAVIERLA